MSENTRYVYAYGRRALCCVCGNLRKRDGRSHSTDEVFELDERQPRGWRMTCRLKCHVCGTYTTHAVLRNDNDPDRDQAELLRGVPKMFDNGCTDEELLREAQRRICNMLRVVRLVDLTLEECHDLLTILKPSPTATTNPLPRVGPPSCLGGGPTRS